MTTDNNHPLYPTNPLNTPASAQKTPPLGEQTGREAMSFTPMNAGGLTSIISPDAYNSGWNNSWDWERSNASVPTYSHNVPSPAPGLFSDMSILGLPIAWPGMYRYFRAILNDPSVRYVRSLAYAPILVTQWTAKGSKNAPKEAAEKIQKMFDPLRLQYLDDAVRGIDYGWAGFEQVYDTLTDGPDAGMIYLCKIKALLHDITSIYVEQNGSFNGFNNNGTLIDPIKALLFTYDGESGNLYGRGRCNNLLETVPWWRDANEGAARYDRKIAGVFLVCHYPPGTSIDKDGKVTENFKIAQQILNSIAAGKPIAVCNEFAGDLMDNGFLSNISMADRTRWRLELLEDKGSRQPGFSDRLAYLDRQKARGFLVPERSAFEAQKSGSRADSESHGDSILVQADITNEALARILNGSAYHRYSPINNILRMNWGESAVNTVTLSPVPIDDSKKAFIRDIAKQLFTSQPAMAPRVADLPQMFEEAGLPCPSDPLTNADLVIELDGMIAQQVQVKGDVGPASKDGKQTLSRIHQNLEQHEKRLNGSGHVLPA